MNAQLLGARNLPPHGRHASIPTRILPSPFPEPRPRPSPAAPPQTHEFMEPEARLNYLNTTAAFDSYKAAQGPKATKSRLRRTMEATWAAEQAMTGAGPPMRGTGTLFGLTSTTRCGAQVGG